VQFNADKLNDNKYICIKYSNFHKIINYFFIILLIIIAVVIISIYFLKNKINLNNFI
jgi:hypothetical protein